MSSIHIGLSALRTAQVGLNNASQNIANAATPGYHRQRADQVSRNTYRVGRGPLLGGGVDAAAVARLRMPAVEQSITANVSGREAASAALDALRQVEQSLQPGEGSIHELVTAFFDAAEQLAANPAESVLRRQAVSAAGELADAIGTISSTLSGVGDQIANEIQSTVQTVNQVARRIADLNREIRVADALGRSVNSLLDQRDLAINELAQYVDVDARSYLDGGDPLVAAGGALLIGETSSAIRAELTTDGRVTLASSTGQRDIAVLGGRLSGLVEAAATIRSGIAADFDEWSTMLVRRLDTIQATGIGLSGPAAVITGSRQFADLDRPLAEVASLFALESGALTVTVTDASGDRQSTRIPVNVGTDSLRDVVARLDALDGVTATVSEAGIVSLLADGGSTIDFAGRMDSRPESQAITGTAVPSVSGIYTDSGNDQWVVEVVSGGSVGVSNGLIIRVSSLVTGELVGDFDFGQGYAAGQPVPLADGIRLSLTPGTLATGDQFTISATGQPDETGLLAALGLQTLFSGSGLPDLRLSSALETTTDHLALSRTGSAADGQQLDRILSLRSEPLFAPGSETIEQRLASITSFSGILVQSQQREVDQRVETQVQLETARDSVSGVDPNEELLEMLQYQRAFQAASRFVTSVEETLDDLMNLIG